VAIRVKSKLRRPPSRPGHNGHNGHSAKSIKRTTKSNSNGKSSSNGKNGKHHSNAVSAYSKAMRFLSTLTDHERLRIVRYNSSTFDLNRMRHLLKKLGDGSMRLTWGATMRINRAKSAWEIMSPLTWMRSRMSQRWGEV